MDIDEMAAKYGLAQLEEFQNTGEEIEFYRSFLALTDHIPNKIIEAQTLEEPVKDYTEILRYRQFARDEINKLES